MVWKFLKFWNQGNLGTLSNGKFIWVLGFRGLGLRLLTTSGALQRVIRKYKECIGLIRIMIVDTGSQAACSMLLVVSESEGLQSVKVM